MCPPRWYSSDSIDVSEWINHWMHCSAALFWAQKFSVILQSVFLLAALSYSGSKNCTICINNFYKLYEYVKSELQIRKWINWSALSLWQEAVPNYIQLKITVHLIANTNTGFTDLIFLDNFDFTCRAGLLPAWCLVLSWWSEEGCTTLDTKQEALALD